MSVRFLPTWPEPFAMPLGNFVDFEFSSNRADSQALAATTTARQRICFSVLVVLSIYDTAFTRPLSSTNSSRAIALLMIERFPVFIAGKIMAWLDVKAEAVRHPRPHCPQ